MKTTLKIFIIMVLLISYEDNLAQTDTTAVYRIILNDDSELLGKIKSESDSLLAFVTNAGLELSIEKQMIKKREFVQGDWRGDTFLRTDLNRTRLFFAQIEKFGKIYE